MSREAVFTPKRTTLETVETVCASFVAVTTFHASCVALSNGQHIQEAVYSEVGWKLAGISTAWDSDLLATFGTRYHSTIWTRSMNPVQTVKTETVQARQLFWLGKCAHAHRTGHCFMQIV